MTRRQFALAAAGSVAAAATATRLTTSVEPSPNPAFEPWSRWQEGSGLTRAVRAAILAANPHNSQPWRFRAKGNQLEVLADPLRRLGSIDPLLREQQMGVGCAMENLILAAASSGMGVRSLAYETDPASDRIASIAFEPQPESRSALYAAIPHRHTSRGPYLPHRPLPITFLRGLDSLNADPGAIRLQLWTDPLAEGQFRELLIAAAVAATADDRQSADSAQWYRATNREIQTHCDGITLDAQGLSPFMTALAKAAPPPSRSMADSFFINNTKHVHCGPGATFGTLFVRTPAAKENIVRAGRLWQRMHLFATAQGVATHPMNQIHERVDRETTSGIDPVFTRGFAAISREQSWSGIFSFRMGYAVRPAKPSPRRDVTKVML